MEDRSYEEYEEMETISGNDLEKDPETGAGDGSGTDHGPGSNGLDVQSPDEGRDQGSDDAGHIQDAGSEKTSQTEVIIRVEEEESKEWRESIKEQLTELIKTEDGTEVTDRLDTLIMMLAPREEQKEGLETYTVSIPFEDYTGWDYPIDVQFQVFPYGMGGWLRQSESFPDADSFTARYEDIISLCQEGGTLKDFYIEYIWDCDEGLVYDYEAQTPEPEPGDEGQKEITDQLLSHLTDVNTTLAGMVQADMEYCQAVYDYQAEMLQLQTANTASTIFICIGVFAIFTVQLWSQLFGRFK